MAERPRKKDPTHNTPPERISRGLLGVATITDRIARPVLGKRGFASGQVIGRWPEIVGDDLAAATAPEKVQFERGGRSAGTLYLRVSSGAAATLIQLQVPTIIERVNAYLGPGAISRIKVNQGPLPKSSATKHPPQATPIQEEDLAAADSDIGALGSEPVRAALVRLGARLKARS
jgi:hypothetical protein